MEVEAAEEKAVDMEAAAAAAAVMAVETVKVALVVFPAMAEINGHGDKVSNL